MKSEKEIRERLEKSRNKLLAINEVFEESPLKEKVAVEPKMSALFGEIDTLYWVLDEKESEKINSERKKLEEQSINITRRQDWIK